MTDIYKPDLTRLEKPEDTEHYFKCWGELSAIGLELEQQLYYMNRRGKPPLDIKGNRKLEKALGKINQPVSHEASAQTLEIKTGAYGPGQVLFLLRDIFNQRARLNEAAYKQGLKISLYGILPQAVFPRLLKNIHPRLRSQVFLRHFTEHSRQDIARYFTTTSSIQTSLSPRTPQHGYDYYRRMVYLLPLLVSVLNTTPPYNRDDTGNWLKTTRNLSLERRLAPYGLENSIPAIFWQNDTTPESFLKKYNQNIWDTPLFCYYTGPDPDKDLHFVEHKEDIKSFRELPDELRTQANFQLAFSIQWHLIRLSALESNGRHGYRIELSFLDNGNEDNLRIAAGLSDILAYNELFQHDIDVFLKKYGFGKPAPETKNLWLETMQSVLWQYGDPEKENYGNACLLQACNDLATILRRYIEAAPELKPLQILLEQGLTLNKIEKEKYKTMRLFQKSL